MGKNGQIYLLVLHLGNCIAIEVDFFNTSPVLFRRKLQSRRIALFQIELASHTPSTPA